MNKLGDGGGKEAGRDAFAVDVGGNDDDTDTGEVDADTPELVESCFCSGDGDIGECCENDEPVRVEDW